MATTKYTYSIQADTPNHKVATDRLTVELQACVIIIALDHINTAGDVLDIYFKDELSEGDQAVLTSVVNNHSGEPLPQNIPQDVNIKASAIILPSQEKGFQDLTGHNFFKKGIKGIALAGQTTDLYLKFNTNMYLPGGGYWVGQTATFGDYIGVQIVDKDGILGYGPGLVLGTFIETDYVWPGREWEVLTGDAKLIPTGIYLRMRYISVGAEDVEFIGWYSMRT